MWRGNGNPNRYTDLNEIMQAHLILFKEGFGASLKKWGKSSQNVVYKC